MSDLLTYAEIEAAYAGQWVLVDDPDLDENNVVLRGRVLWHSSDRDEVYSKARELRPRRAAILFTGTIPAGAAVEL
jgi:hypothetical protein